MRDDPDDVGWLRGWAGQFREEAARDRAGRIAGGRLLLECVPDDVRDLDAAAACECSCHPQPERTSTHHDEMCVCQLTPTELRERPARANVALGHMREAFAPIREQHARELAEAGAPWVLVGAVDGPRSACRERWGNYTVTVAPDGRPDLNPWGAPEDAATITIVAGTENDLYVGRPPDYREAVGFIVAKIRTYLGRQTWTHPLTPADRYGPGCGAPLVDEAVP